MHFDGTLILLYFIEMLPHMVSLCSALIAQIEQKGVSVKCFVLLRAETAKITESFDFIVKII